MKEQIPLSSEGKKEKPKNNMNRREFLSRAMKLTAALALGATAMPDQARADEQGPFVNQDSDLNSRGNKEFMEGQGITCRQESVEIGKEKFMLTILEKDGPEKLAYFVPHDSEDAAFDTALRSIASGGKVVALENKDTTQDNSDDRYLYSVGEKEQRTCQDPNLIFDSSNKYWPLAEKILAQLGSEQQDMIIALHNTGRGGKLTLDNVVKRPNAKVLSQGDPNSRNMIWITGTTPNPSPEIMKEAEFYKTLKLNVVYEHISPTVKNNTSLSVYATRQGIPFRNIEVLAGLRGNKESEINSREIQMKYLSALKRFHAK